MLDFVHATLMAAQCPLCVALAQPSDSSDSPSEACVTSGRSREKRGRNVTE